jgi:hypothetical protein
MKELKSSIKIGKLSFLTLLLFSFSTSSLLCPEIAYAKTPQTFNADDVRLPDWTNISFTNLGGVLEAGQYEDRSWQAGDKLDRILTLDDISEDFAPQKFEVGQILDIAGVNSKDISLSDFPLVGKQSLRELVAAVPELGEKLPTDVAPIAELLDSMGILSTYDTNRALPNLGELVQDDAIAQLSLDQINLEEFGLDSIPNLDLALIEDFANWEEELIGAIPGLTGVPLAMMPIPLLPTDGVVARIDGVWSKYESNRNRTVSGSDRVGFNYPCQVDCAYIELDDLENIGMVEQGFMEGKQWISGKYQWVEGGSGCLVSSEPTGRHPFGKAFKVVVWEPNESSDTVDTKIFFRFKILCGKSPYILGPFPFLNYKVNDLIYLGPLDLEAHSIKTPTLDASNRRKNASFTKASA